MVQTTDPHDLLCYKSPIFSFFAGEALKQFYYPILVPIGIFGNILSFLVRTLADQIKPASVM